jgi:hypothetical protein
LYFIFDQKEIYKESKDYSKVFLINEYIINRAELYFKATLNKLTQTQDWILNSIYAISYKTPIIFHKLINQLRIMKDKKQKKLIQCLLTVLFCHIIDG